MSVISFINHKGGVGKTTLVLNIAAEMAYNNLNVLLVDLDPQMNLTLSLLGYQEWEQTKESRKTLNDWYRYYLMNHCVNDLSNYIYTPKRINSFYKNNNKVSILCADIDLINTDVELAIKTEDTQKKSLELLSLLKNGVDLIKNNYDVILFDCPPNFGVSTRNAILASDYYIIPDKADYLSIIGLELLTKNIDKLVEEFNLWATDNKYDRVNPSCLGIIFTMVKSYKGFPIASQKHIMQQVENLGLYCFQNTLRESPTVYSSNYEKELPIVLSNVSGLQLEVRHEIENITLEICEKAKIY